MYINTYIWNLVRWWASLVAQTVKNSSAMGETWVQSLGWEDPLQEGLATHSSILAWNIPLDRGAWHMIHGIGKSWIGLSGYAQHIYVCVCVCVCNVIITAAHQILLFFLGTW